MFVVKACKLLLMSITEHDTWTCNDRQSILANMSVITQGEREHSELCTRASSRSSNPNDEKSFIALSKAAAAFEALLVKSIFHVPEIRVDSTDSGWLDQAPAISWLLGSQVQFVGGPCPQSSRSRAPSLTPSTIQSVVMNFPPAPAHKVF